MRRLRRASLWLHRWLGLTAGLLLVPIGLSGSLLVFRPELERVLTPELHVVTVGEQQASADVLLAAAQAARPGDPVLRVTFPNRPDGTVMAALGSGDAAFLDPYTGAVLGIRGPREGLMPWLFDFHHFLLSGQTGLVITGILGLVLLALGISGMVVWWRGWRRLKRGLTVARGPWRRTNYDLHNAAGAWTLPLLMLAALTGSALVFHEAAAKVAYVMTGSAPPPPGPTVAPPADDLPQPLAAQIAAAQAVFPDAHVHRFDLPFASEVPLRVRLRQVGELHPNGMTVVHVDPFTATVLHTDDALQASAAAKLLNLRYPLHIGRYGGLFMRIVMVIVGLVPALLFVTGLVMWWKPKRKKPVRRAVPPPPGFHPVAVPRPAEKRAV